MLTGGVELKVKGSKGETSYNPLKKMKRGLQKAKTSHMTKSGKEDIFPAKEKHSLLEE